jgi:hypothetical protein
MSSKEGVPLQNTTGIEKPLCFILMPITDPEGYEKGHFRTVYEDIFRPACEKAGFMAVRADDVGQANLIHLDILQKLIDCPMALCDLSGQNSNALFELGLRQAFDKPVVLVQETGTPQIFDIAPLRYFEYRGNLQYRDVLEDQDKIANAIKLTQEASRTGQGVNSIVKLLSLTHPAALTRIGESDKDSAWLQIIMAELKSMRTEIRTGLSLKALPPHLLNRYLDPGKFQDAIDMLDTDMRDVRRILEAVIKGDTSELTDEINLAEELDGLTERLTDFRDSIAVTGDERQSKRLQILAQRMKRLKDRYARSSRVKAEKLP